MKNVKKLVCLAIATAILTGSLTSCTSNNTTVGDDSSNSNGGYIAGTYSSTVDGFGGKMVVEVEFSETEIKSVTIKSNSETDGIGSNAIEKLPDEITSAQSTSVDTVGGATVSSNAIKTAVNDCIVQAGGNITTKEITKGDDEEITVDVAVIGMGAAGTMAAISASQNGAKVIGVEMAGSIGGNGLAAQGMFATGTSLQEERGEVIDNNEEYWFNRFMTINSWLSDAALTRTFISEAKNTVDWLTELGVPVYLSDVPQQIGHNNEQLIYHRWANTNVSEDDEKYWSTSNTFELMENHLNNLGVELRTNTTATKLLTNDLGEVTGLLATKADGSILTINASSVIVATGGYSGNEEMVKEALGNAYGTVEVMPGRDGSGIQMCYEVGAAEDGTNVLLNHGLSTGVRDEKYNGAIEEILLNTPILWVNKLGQRFMPEDLINDTVLYSSAVLAQGGSTYTIIDQATLEQFTKEIPLEIHYWDRNGIVDENGNKTYYHAPLDLDTFNSDLDILVEAGMAYKAETIEELAKFIGCDVSTLSNTITTYNGYVKNKSDEQFFKDPKNLLYTIENGPYYCVKGVNQSLGSVGGVDINSNIEAISTEGKVIPGLYVPGANAGGISDGAYVNVEGAALGFALTSGRLAGSNAAKYASSTK